MAIMRVKKINLTDQVYSQLKRSLLTGEWTEGTRIPSENTLCKEIIDKLVEDIFNATVAQW